MADPIPRPPGPAGETPEAELETELKRLRLRSWRRGTREMDLVLGPFADARLATLGPADLAAYDTLLSENDQDLYSWVSGARPAPARLSEILALIRAFHSLEPREDGRVNR
jgi:antitoxin CptB